MSQQSTAPQSSAPAQTGQQTMKVPAQASKPQRTGTKRAALYSLILLAIPWVLSIWFGLETTVENGWVYPGLYRWAGYAGLVALGFAAFAQILHFANKDLRENPVYREDVFKYDFLDERNVALVAALILLLMGPIALQDVTNWILSGLNTLSESWGIGLQIPLLDITLPTWLSNAYGIFQFYLMAPVFVGFRLLVNLLAAFGVIILVLPLIVICGMLMWKTHMQRSAFHRAGTMFLGATMVFLICIAFYSQIPTADIMEHLFRGS